MTKQIYDFGLIGLGTMGKNFLLNVAEKNFSAIGYDRDIAKVDEVNAENSTAYGVNDLQTFITSLSTPRKIMMLIPAGKLVDTVIEDMLPHLESGDVIMDGGNTFFADTERRQTYLSTKNINYLCVGISGGAEGARKGPSMMPSGNMDAYKHVESILSAAAATADGQSCVAYLGKGGAGNYVKMVHNGIEYGLMQILAEVYDIMKRGLSLSNEEMGAIFSEWNTGRLHAYLVEILPSIFTAKDDNTQQHVLDVIVDKAKQKGTGKWTSQESFNVGEPAPTITAAVLARAISGFKEQREEASKLYPLNCSQTIHGNTQEIIKQLEEATYFAFLVTYAQGMALLKTASDEYNYNLDQEKVTAVWRGGCIIRASLLEILAKTFSKQPNISNVLLDTEIAQIIGQTSHSARATVIQATQSAIPTPCLSASLSYFDSYRSMRLPVNLVQAQRDFFGAHSFERTDAEGNYHHTWQSIES
ncbi:MAG: NADP-dependent phosphogluconate dehydrogenase [Gammaproteobacteria bacterium]|nr:NADP-dependent phosphogluconate dehydrogenase [Gammaproteobacteria bacterium]